MRVNRFLTFALILIPFLPFGIINNLLITFFFILLILKRRSFLKAIIILIYAIIIYLLSNPFFNISNYFVACVSWLPLLIILLDKNLNFRLLSKDSKWLTYLFYIQTAIAIFQLITTIILYKTIDLGFGDYIQGSLNIFSPINGRIGFNNQLFVIAYTFLYFLIRKLNNESIIKFDHKLLLYILVLFSASVLHVILVIFISLFISLVEIKKPRRILSFSSAVVVILLLMALVKKDEFRLLINSGQLFLDLPKIGLVIDFLAKVKWTHFLIGFGPGNGIDRVLFYLVDGGYNYPSLGLHVPDNLNEYANQYLSYKQNVDKFGNSTLFRPFSSIISIFYNFGIVGAVSVGLILARTFFLDEKTKFLIFFLAGLAFFETYIELPVVSIMFVVALRLKANSKKIKFEKIKNNIY